VGVPDQLCASPRFIRISINRRGCNVLFEPVQLGFKIFKLLFDIPRVLEASMSVARNSHSLDQHLIVFDQRIYAAEDGLEGREPVG